VRRRGGSRRLQPQQVRAAGAYGHCMHVPRRNCFGTLTAYGVPNNKLVVAFSGCARLPSHQYVHVLVACIGMHATQ
jgi:hypothetical protein